MARCTSISRDYRSRQRTNPRSRSSSLGLFITLLYCACAPEALAQDLPKLSSTVVRGSSLFSPSELFELYSGELGKPITRERAQAIVERLAERYDQDGYSRPRITVDDDLVSIGVLRIDVLEPRIANVEIQGDPGPYRSRLEALCGRLTGEHVLQRGELAALIQRMRALRGLTLTASTTPFDDDPGSYRLVLDTDYEPVGGVMRFTNRGTDQIGPNFLLGQVQTHGLFAGSTNLGLQFGAATDYDEYRGLGLSIDTALGAEGARMQASAHRSRSDPLEPGIDRDHHYLRDRANITARVPVADRTTASSNFSIGLAYDDLLIDRAGALLRDERLRMLEIGWSGSWRTSNTVQKAATIEFVQGLGGLGSRLVATDLSNDPRQRDFTFAFASLVRLARLDDRWTTRLDVFVQYTNNVLPFTKRFKIGGDRLGRGFEIAEIAGDSGLGAKVELRRTLDRAPSFLGRTSVYGYYDLGAAWKNDAPGRESAATGGFGISIQSARLIGNLELAKPLTRADVEGRRNTSAFLELTMLF